MHKTFKVRYKDDDVYTAISYCVNKLYSILEIGFGIKLVQMSSVLRAEKKREGEKEKEG